MMMMCTVQDTNSRNEDMVYIQGVTMDKATIHNSQ